MADSNPEAGTTRRPSRRGAWLAGMIVLTLSAGVAAKMAAPADPVATPSYGGFGPIHAHAQVDRTSVLQGSDGLVRIELELRADAPLVQGEAPRVPTDLVVVLDRSGSMQGQPLDFAKAAIRELIGQLGHDDRFGLVTYASDGNITIPLEAASNSAKVRWQHDLTAVREGGGTNMALGLDLAHNLLAAQTAGRAPRVVLLSDGHANQGDHSLSGLRGRAARAVAGEYVMSSVGVGDGFDESVMSAVADAGTGNFYYLPELSQLAGVFSDEFASARETMASALLVSISNAAKGVRLESASGYPLEALGGAAVFRPGNLSAGQERKFWLTLRIPTANLGDFDVPPIHVEYTDDKGDRQKLSLGNLPEIACVVGEDDYYASFEADVYKRGFVSESLGELKEKVAAKMKAGDREDAVALVSEHQEEARRTHMRALGYVIQSADESMNELHDTVAAPAAAEPEVQNKLGKSLLQDGRDQRRSGSKRR